MPLPLVPLAFGAAALAGYYFLVKKPADAAAAASGALPGTPRATTQINTATGTASALPTGFPAELAGKFQTLLSQGRDPDAMDQVADRCEALGYQTQALQLRMRAAEIRRQLAAGQAPAPAPAPVPAYSPPASTPSYTPPPPAFVPGVFDDPLPSFQDRTAVVTTNDPPPSGDLIIRSSPSGTAQQIGGAEKNGTVTILDASDPTWAKVSWSGGSRWPAVTGYARKAYLRDSSGAVIGKRSGHRQADLIGKRSGHRQADLIGRLGPRFNRNY